MFRKIKLQQTEYIFFIAYFIILPVLTRLQYSNYFKGTLAGSIVYYTLSGILTIIIYLPYYKIILPKFFFTKKYLWFSISTIAFVIFSNEAFHLSNVLIYELLNHLKFLSTDIRTAAAPTSGLASFQEVSISITIYNLMALTALGYFIKTVKEEFINNQLKQSQLKLELDGLKAQLQPHFFFNTLNNIYSQALAGSKDTALTIARLSDLMRYILYECSQELVPLKHEIEFIKSYVALEEIRHQQNARISFEFQGKTDHIFISPFLLMPLIENGFKHGINEDVNDCSLSIVVSVIDDELIAEIKNTKPSLVLNRIKQVGIGLQNLKKRLELLYPQKHALTFLETETNFEAYFTLMIK